MKKVNWKKVGDVVYFSLMNFLLLVILFFLIGFTVDLALKFWELFANG